MAVAASVMASLVSVPQAIADATGLANSDRGFVPGYWTPERYASAKPFPLPQATGSLGVETEAAQSGPSEGGAASGQPPTLKVAPDYRNILFVPHATAADQSEAVEPQDFGTSGFHYTSARMVPAAASAAELVYPNRINGKLFFTQPGVGNFVCSGTVGRLRIVFTAGHCVSDGNGNFFTNFSFVPAFRNGAAPFGSWTWTFVAVDNRWHTGGGGFPNSGDFGWLELVDQAGGRIGDVVGFSGFFAGTVSGVPNYPNHPTVVGYPCNIDSCAIMHRVDAQSGFDSSRNAIIGSDMTGGSSGGGWFQNFGEYGTGQPPGGGPQAIGNAWIGPTSYGRTDTAIRLQGISIPDGTWFNILNSNLVCGRRPGNC